MADVKVSALTTLSSIAEEDVFVVNDDDAVGEKVKKATTAVLRSAILLPGVDNTNDIGSATKQIKDIYLEGTITQNAIPQGKDVTAALHRKIVDIGDWDMDSTASVTISSGITYTKLRSIYGVVRSDSGVPYPIAPYTGGSEPGVSVTLLDGAGAIHLQRLAGGLFDSTNFNYTAYNRGWIIIDYVD